MDAQQRPAAFALVQAVAAVLTFALDAFTIAPGAVLGVGAVLGLNLVNVAATSRLFRSFAGFGGASLAGPLAEFYGGGEAALAFTCIGMLAALVAGVLPFLGWDESTWYYRPATWFFASAVCGFAPFGYMLGIGLQPGFGFNFGPAFYTSIVMIVLGFLFGCIEKGNVAQTVQAGEMKP